MVKKGDRVINVLSGLIGTVVSDGACTVVDLDEGRQVRGDFRAWLPYNTKPQTDEPMTADNQKPSMTKEQLQEFSKETVANLEKQVANLQGQVNRKNIQIQMMNYQIDEAREIVGLIKRLMDNDAVISTEHLDSLYAVLD